MFHPPFVASSHKGVLKGVAAVALGLVFMTGAEERRMPSLTNLLGISMVLVGGSWYSSLQCTSGRNLGAKGKG